MAEHEVDVVVIGGGAMGLSTAWWLAPRARVVVLERFEQGHNRGASHGGERIFRYLYPDAAYVEMALAADEGWQRLEHDAGRQLLHRVGCVEHGSTAELDALAQAADQFGVATEQLTAGEASARWPAMRFETDALVQRTAGWVRAADTLERLAALAGAAGADIRFGTQVAAVELDDDCVRVHVGGAPRRDSARVRGGDSQAPPDDGVRIGTGQETYRADVVVVTAGAWATDLLSDVALPPLLTTEEHVFFFELAGDAVVPAFLHFDDIVRYGLPGPSGLVKIGEHHTGTITTGDDRTFAPDPERAARMEHYVADWFPGLAPKAVDTTTCLYTSTATHDFVIDRVGPVVVGAGFSGHGFKFVPEVGRRLAALATGEASSSTPPFALASHTA